jgi:hypothetical protein
MRPCFRLLIALTVPLLSIACSKDKKPEPAGDGTQSTSVVAVEPGIAGGVIEETTTLTAKVEAVDQKTRKVTLKGEDGDSATFTAGPEVKNLDQVKVGDTLKAVLKERLTVYVKKGGDPDASATYAAAVAAAPKGAKPGAMIGESYEVIASVTAIDAKTRTATLKFVDGRTKQVKVRDDVDLTRYAVGDMVVIRVSVALGLLVTTP